MSEQDRTEGKDRFREAAEAFLEHHLPGVRLPKNISFVLAVFFRNFYEQGVESVKGKAND